MSEPVILTMIFILFCIFLKILWELQEIKEIKMSIDCLIDFLAEEEVKEEVLQMYREQDNVLTKEDLRNTPKSKSKGYFAEASNSEVKL